MAALPLQGLILYAIDPVFCFFLNPCYHALPSRTRNENMFSGEYRAHRSNGGVMWTCQVASKSMNDMPFRAKVAAKLPPPAVLGVKMI